MRVVITGSGGFIGRATVRAARHVGHTIASFDRRDGLDVQNPIDLDLVLTDADAVIHLAGVLGTAELFDNPHEAVNVNIHGTLNVLQACENLGLRYVGITMPPVFPSVYTATKVCADRLATAWHKARGVPVSHVKAYNAYGPGQAHGLGHPQKIVPTFASYAWAGKPIPVWGDGNQTVDLIHANDLGRLLVEALGHGDDVTFDGGTGEAFTVNQVAEMTNEICGSSAGIAYLPMRAGETPTTIIAKGDGWERLGGWSPTFEMTHFVAAVESYRPC